MNTPSALIALCACALWLGGCDKTPEYSPTPTDPMPVQTEPGSTAGSASDPSVPSAESALPAADTGTVGPTLARRSNGTPSAAQESKAMPMPGQNNDHSSPLRPGQRASAP